MLAEYGFLLSNVAAWAIVLVAFIAYALILDLSFFRPQKNEWLSTCEDWIPSLRKLLAALPLLGLLGTISGLMSTFTSISTQHSLAVEELLTGGIAEAMYTTQLGLVLVIPGLLLLGLLKNQMKKWKAIKHHET